MLKLGLLDAQLKFKIILTLTPLYAMLCKEEIDYMKQTNVKLNQDIKQNPNFATAQEKYKKLVLSFANGTNYSSFTEGWNFYTDLAAILETERAYGHQDLTFEMLVNDMSKMSEKKIAKKYQAYAIGTIARYARSIEAKKYERIIKEKD